MNKFKMLVLKAKSLIIPTIICLFTFFRYLFSYSSIGRESER